MIVGKIISRLKKREPAEGLSDALQIVDKCMMQAERESTRAMDFLTGYAHGRIELLFEHGKITENEKEAALRIMDERCEKFSIMKSLEEHDAG